MSGRKIYSRLILWVLIFSLLPIHTLVSAVSEETLEVVKELYVGDFPSGATISTSSSWHARISNDGEEYQGKQSMKIQIDSLWSGFWPVFDVNFATPMTISNRNATLLSFDIKMPAGRSRDLYFYFKTKDSSGRGVNSVINLANFVSEAEIGEWKHVSIPLSYFSENGEYWNSSLGANQQLPVNYANVVGYGFKCGAENMGIGYTCLFNNVRLLYGELSEPGLDISKSEDGSYYTIFKDACESGRMSYWGGATRFSVADPSAVGVKPVYSGDRGFFVMFDNTQSWPGGYLHFSDTVNLKKEYQKLALRFRFFASADAELKIGFLGENLGKSYKVECDLRNFQNSFDGSLYEILIPLAAFGTYGVYYGSNGNESALFPWERVKSLSFTINTSGLSSVYYAYLDDIQIVAEQDYQIQAEAKALSETTYYREITNHSLQPLNIEDYSTTNYDTWSNESDWGDDFRAFNGGNTFLGIPFDMNPEQVIMLRGTPDKSYPAEVMIPLNQTTKGIYFLHTGVDIKGTTAYQFEVTYSDSTKLRQKVRNNRAISDWKLRYATDEGRTVHTFVNQAGNTVGMGVWAWVNPYPEKSIASIRLLSDDTNGCPAILAMTLTDSYPIMIETEKEPEANPDTSNWFVYEQPEADKISGTALDMSLFLDAPAGKHGFVKRVGENFVFENTNEEIHFYGVNLVAEAVFQSKEKADILIDRIASAGYNMVRFHHMDADWVRPNVFGNGSSTLTLDADSLDRFEYLWAGLKKRGVYLYVDGVVLRTFRSGETGSYPVGAFSAGGKTATYFVEIIQQRQREYFEQLFTHVNPYTGTSLAEDPALVMVDFQNEDSLLWRPALRWNLYNQSLRNLISQKFGAWLKNKYRTDAALQKAWGDKSVSGLETAQPSVYLAYNYLTAGYSKARVADTRAFLLDLQTQHYRQIYEYCRNTLGMKCMFTGSNAPEEINALDLYSNAQFGGEYIDQHSYMNHPTWGEWGFESGILSTDAFDTMMCDAESEGMIDYFGERTVSGMPFVASEWNQCEPNQYLGAGMLMFPAYSAMHGWNTLQFNFLQGSLPSTDALYDLLGTYNHPVKTAVAHSVAPMLLRGDITETDAAYYTAVNPQTALDPTYQPPVPDGISLIGKSGIYFTDSTAPTQTMELAELAAEANETGVYVSYEKEMRTDTKNQLFELNTTATQAYAGFADGTVVLEDVDFDIENDYATVILTSLEKEKGIRNAERLLLTATARCRNSDMILSDEGTYVVYAGHSPILVEPVSGIVRLKTKDRYRIYALDSTGRRMSEIATTVDADGAQILSLSPEARTMYYELIKTEDVKEDKVSGERPEWSNGFKEENAFVNNDIVLFRNDMQTWNRLLELKKTNAVVSKQTNYVEDAYGNKILPWYINLYSTGSVKHIFTEGFDLSDLQAEGDAVLAMDIKVYNLSKRNDKFQVRLEDSEGRGVYAWLPNPAVTEDAKREESQNGWLHYEFSLSDMIPIDAINNMDIGDIKCVSFAAESWQGGEIYLDYVKFTKKQPQLIAVKYYDKFGSLLSERKKESADSMVLCYNKAMNPESLSGISLLYDGVEQEISPVYDPEGYKVSIPLKQATTAEEIRLIVPATVRAGLAIGSVKSNAVVDTSVDCSGFAIPTQIYVKGTPQIFYEQGGTPIKDITKQTTVYAEVFLPYDGVVAIAVYQGKTLKSVLYEEMSAGIRTTRTVSVEPGQAVRVMLWTTGMKPLCNPYTLE